jgi:hypothetical protein
MNRAIAAATRGGTQTSGMGRVARDLMGRAVTAPRPGIIDGAVDLWQARRAASMTRIVAEQSRDMVRVAQSAQDLIAMERETEVRLSRLDLELDQIAYAQKVIMLNAQDVDQQIVIQRLTFGDRARAAMSAARRRAIEGETKLVMAQGYLGEIQRRVQLGPADFGELSPDSNDDFADVIDHPNATRRH